MTKPAAKTAPVAQSRTSVSKTGGVSNQQVDELTNQVMDMRLNLEGLEKERDFYFSKLRDIEILCQEAEEADATPIIQKILEILYATEVFCTNKLQNSQI
jgi:microtubule-associated protein, RP/EB family